MFVGSGMASRIEKDSITQSRICFHNKLLNNARHLWTYLTFSMTKIYKTISRLRSISKSFCQTNIMLLNSCLPTAFPTEMFLKDAISWIRVSLCSLYMYIFIYIYIYVRTHDIECCVYATYFMKYRVAKYALNFTVKSCKSHKAITSMPYRRIQWYSIRWRGITAPHCSRYIPQYQCELYNWCHW